MKNLCIIPARSGSKGLKDKNIKPLCGKPLIAFTIEAAIKSDIFDIIMVSTDSEKYASIARDFGADVPFLRDEQTSSDGASSWDAVKEVLNKYKEKGICFENVVLLQPTSPLRDADDIIKAYHLYNEKKANYVVSVCEVDHSPLWCNRLPSDFSLKGFIDKRNYNLPRQKLGTYYRFNGAIYIIKTEYLEKSAICDYLDDRAYAYIMDKKHSIDIDDELDFVEAELLYKRFNIL